MPPKDGKASNPPAARVTATPSGDPKTSSEALQRVGGGEAIPTRVSVNRTYKMFVGGAFVRSESGRYVQTRDANETESPDPITVNVPRGSRKDARDAVLAAKNAQPGWAARTAYNRGQIVYRLAEMMEGRRLEFVASLERGGLAHAAAAREIDAAVDRAVYYAGFADKFQALLASSNPVSGPHFGFSVPDPMGIVAVVAPQRPVLLGLISTVLPAIVSGNTVVVVASPADPRSAVVLCECLATSDLPGGVVNLLTGDAAEIAPHLCKHREVAGVLAFTEDVVLARAMARDAVGSVKRFHAEPPLDAGAWTLDGVGQGLGWIERHLEIKTIWHPVGV